jgi:hypothetical protein
MRAEFIRPAILQESADDTVRCLTCERRCVIPEGERGWCATRQNVDGTLHTLIYGAVSSLSRRIADDLGSDTPWHLSRYFPAYRFDRSATPVSTLERAREIATRAGLRYVYLGNVPRHPGEDTICPECGTILIRRDGFRSRTCNLTPEGRCSRCGEEIPGVGW